MDHNNYGTYYVKNIILCVYIYIYIHINRQLTQVVYWRTLSGGTLLVTGKRGRMGRSVVERAGRRRRAVRRVRRERR